MRASTTLACLGLLLLVAGAAAQPAASPDEDRADRIRELLELTGSAKLGIQMMNNMLGPMKQAVPQVPDEWWETFMAKVDPDDLSRLVIPIYEQHLTDEEIDGMLEFYRTPVGRSVIAKMPIILQESMAAGQAWGQAIARDVFRELKADGYEVPQTR